MSIKIMTEVWEYSEHSGHKLMLMLAIADHANDEGRVAWPSYDKLAKKCRLSRRQTITLIQELEDSRELVIERGGGRGRSNRYIVQNLHPLEKQAKSAGSDQTVQSDEENSAVSTPKGEVAIAPESSIEPSLIEPSIEPSFIDRQKQLKSNLANQKELRSAISVYMGPHARLLDQAKIEVEDGVVRIQVAPMMAERLMRASLVNHMEVACNGYFEDFRELIVEGEGDEREIS